MDSSKLVGPDGKPIPKTLCVEFDGALYPYRVVSQDVLNTKDPRIGLLGVLVQIGDQQNVLWLALMALAKDIYSRDPKPNAEGITEGGIRERHFQKLAEAVGISILDGERKATDVAAELRKV